MRWGWILAALLIAIGLAPVAGVALSLGLAGVAGCEVNEASVQICRVAGIDLGPLLAALFVGGWLMFMTAPIALAGFALGIGLAIASLWRRMRD